MHIKINEELIVRKIDDEVIIYDRNRSHVHSFNATGVFIWTMIEKGCEKEEIVKALIGEFDIDAVTAEVDVGDFCKSLVLAGLAME